MIAPPVVVLRRLLGEMPEMAKDVVVAKDVVAFTPVKFCKVVEPVCRVLLKVERPAVAVKVPVKLAREEMF